MDDLEQFKKTDIDCSPIRYEPDPVYTEECKRLSLMIQVERENNELLSRKNLELCTAYNTLLNNFNFVKNAYESMQSKLELWKSKAKIYKPYFDIYVKTQRKTRKYSDGEANDYLTEALKIVSCECEKEDLVEECRKKDGKGLSQAEKTLFIKALTNDVDKLRWENYLLQLKLCNSAKKTQTPRPHKHSLSVPCFGSVENEEENINEEEIEEKKRRQPDFFCELDVSAIREANKTSQSIMYNETSFLFRKK